jgi:hypothetical protein
VRILRHFLASVEKLNPTVAAALIGAIVSVIGAAISLWTATEKKAEQHRQEMSYYREPLANSAYELQGRLRNIIRDHFVQTYYVSGNDRTRPYVLDHTAFVVGQYLCWAENVRRSIQYIDLGENTATLKLKRSQDYILATFQTDKMSPLLRLFAGEQEALGEAMRQINKQDKFECIGYGSFIKVFSKGANPLVDAIRADVESMATLNDQNGLRMAVLQNQLIDLIDVLDPDYVRFRKERRDKVAVPASGQQYLKPGP